MSSLKRSHGSGYKTFALEDGRVVVDVLDEDSHWEVSCAAVPPSASQTEPGKKQLSIAEQVD